MKNGILRRSKQSKAKKERQKRNKILAAKSTFLEKLWKKERNNSKKGSAWRTARLLRPVDAAQ